MEIISPKLLKYVDITSKKLINNLLKYWYRPNIKLFYTGNKLEQQLQIEEILCRRRCMDWSILSLANSGYGVYGVPGLIVIPKYISVKENKLLLANINNTDAVAYTLNQMPEWLLSNRPYSANTAMIAKNPVWLMREVVNYGDYIAILCVKNTDICFTHPNKSITVPALSLVLLSYQARNQSVRVDPGAIIYMFDKSAYPEKLRDMRFTQDTLPTRVTPTQPVPS